MSGRERAALLLQTLLIVCTVIASISLQTAWSAAVGTAVLGIGLIALQAAPRLSWRRVWPTGWAGASAFRMLVWMSLMLTTLLIDLSFVAVAALASAALVVANRRADNASKNARWKMLVLVWLGFLDVIWLVTGYDLNLREAFYCGLLSIVTLLLLYRLWFRPGPIGVQIVNTLVLLLVGLPVASLFYHFHFKPDVRPENYSRYYSFDKAKGDPSASARARQFYIDNWLLFERQFFESSHLAAPSFCLRPNNRGFFVRCPISINSKGFRGREISTEKDGIYRIVALGESTTFGMTCAPNDRPWPELLEQMIRERLKTRRPVEVINAGTPGYTLCDNLASLPSKILPLKPDMIISYHGANGFHMLDDALVRPVGGETPTYTERPFKLAADFEYQIRLRQFLTRERKARHSRPTPTDPMQTKFADAYRQLIQIAAKNGIRLMLAHFCLSVNGKSAPPVIDFYQGGFPDSIRGWITANAVHSQMLQQLAGQYPEVRLIDTHPHLDGEYEKFIDLIHFTQEGRQQLAENMFAGIKKTLEDDIGR